MLCILDSPADCSNTFPTDAFDAVICQTTMSCILRTLSKPTGISLGVIYSRLCLLSGLKKTLFITLTGITHSNEFQL